MYKLFFKSLVFCLNDSVYLTFNTNVFSLSGISRAVVSRASSIRKQNTPLLGFGACKDRHQVRHTRNHDLK